MMTSTALDWIVLIMLGGLTGALGQSARVLVGFKKLDDQAALEGKDRTQLMSTSRLVVSIGIGFTAGALAALFAKPNPASINLDQLLAFAAAGYAGADFIEGVMTRVVPSAPAAAGTVGYPVSGKTISNPNSTAPQMAQPVLNDDAVG